MPIFTKLPKVISKRKIQRISPEMIDAYKQYIEDLEENESATLKFEEGENIKLGRRALQQAALALEKPIKVMKVRGSQDTLRFERISQEEYEALQQSFKARAVKIRAGRKKA
jgi:hypothetical protein